jgi:hypothetical protein
MNVTIKLDEKKPIIIEHRHQLKSTQYLMYTNNRSQRQNK